MTARRSAQIRFGWLGIALVAAALALGACGGDDKPDPKLPPANSSEAFKDGYAKGCPAGLENAGKANPNWANSLADPRYSQDLEYKRGWDRGFFTCFDNEYAGSTSGGFSLDSLNPF